MGGYSESKAKFMMVIRRKWESWISAAVMKVFLKGKRGVTARAILSLAGEVACQYPL